MATKKKSSVRTKPDSKVKELVQEKLASSGLDLDDAKQLGMEALTGFSTQQLHRTFEPLPSLKIPYFGMDGKPMQPMPEWPQFYRVRYLEAPATFDAQTDAKTPRYVNEPDAGVAAYFPRLKTMNWLEIAQDPDEPIILTEGELKAAKACKEGFPTVGLGGVFNFRSPKIGVVWLREFEDIVWVKRHVYICFDSDYRTNPNICSALNKLGEELIERGAIVYMVSLPEVMDDPEAKTGLDDFFVAEPNAEEQFRDLLHYAEPLGLAKPLWSLNDQVVYVRDPGLVINRHTDQKMSPSAFKEHAFSVGRFMEQRVRADGSMSYVKVAASAAWLCWPLRFEVERLTYQPGQDRLIEMEDNRTLLNSWKGWGVEPKKGQVKPFLQLLDHLFSGAPAEARQWFIRWLAYPLQHPGTKMFCAAVMYGVRHGTGKSLVGYTMGRIYGDNFVELSKTDLQEGDNDWAEAKQFVLGDEVTSGASRDMADKLKKFITQREFRINIKYVPRFTIQDFINYYFTSNHPDAFFMEDDDRRMFVHEVVVGPLADKFYDDYMAWLDGGGASALFHYLLNLDLGDFNPASAALNTAAKERMILDTKSDLADWVARLKAAPEEMLKAGSASLKRDLFTNKELLLLYDPDQRTGTTGNGLGRELRRSGIPMAYGGRLITGDGFNDRFYILRNETKWLNADRKALLKHLASTQKGKRQSKY